MKLNDEQINCYEESGYLLLPELLNTAEVAELQVALPDVLKRQGPEIIREQDNSQARLAFGAHVYNETYQRLSLHSSLLGPVQQLLQDDVYIHQSRINPKPGFGEGGAWSWHQDYPPWLKIDGMSKPRCVMVAVFIDDCTTVNSPLLVLPGSQNHGLLAASAHEDTIGRGYDLQNIDSEIVSKLADEHGIEALTGPAGSVAFVNCNVIHGSANNISPWRRAIMYLIYNAVSNACTGTQRPWYQNNRDFTPLKPLND
ncbi:MAG: phytanoyl-CoA dioxygenase family protein [Lentisphaeria bacterium]|nr:phytanoyl-CoA dioxygenase family protein [Lentisphaeria bacterium]NQZ69207.1 phytanoyl-CoA dioxygenase family protein [Lentisphaeria bacterium]